MDKENLEELISFILGSIKLIKERFEPINVSDDFLYDNDGLMRLDAISMRIQAIGESLKNIYKNDKEFLLSIESDDYWSNIIRTRDFISHHYIELDSEVIYNICDEDLEKKILELKGKL